MPNKKIEIPPLRARTMTLHQLQNETLSLIRKVRFQFNHQPHDPGMNDTEFIEHVLHPMEEKIYADQCVLKMHRKARRRK